MLSESDLILPSWPAPANVRAIQTTRKGGVSVAPYDSLNLGEHTGDNLMQVAANRQLLNRHVPTEPVWLKQVHGTTVVDATLASCAPVGDAAIARQRQAVCVVMTADCLPVLLCDRAGTVVAVAHAGWRGLLDGVIESTVAAMQVAPEQVLVWLGPAIGPQAFEVGAEVREAFMAKDIMAVQAFVARPNDKWLADIYLLARQRLAGLGITQIYGGEYCTYNDTDRFFSYRRDGVTGRMASMIWLT